MTYKEWVEKYVKNFEQKETKDSKSDIIKLEQEIREYIKSNENLRKLNISRQNKHRIGTKEYEQKAENLKKKGQYGPSYVTIDDKKIKELISKYTGTGEKKLNKNGQWDNKETIFDNDTIVGIVIDNINGNTSETTVFKIHYSEKGAHIVPDYPSKKKNRKGR